jgi:hypothetical protein
LGWLCWRAGTPYQCKSEEQEGDAKVHADSIGFSNVEHVLSDYKNYKFAIKDFE